MLIYDAFFTQSVSRGKHLKKITKLFSGTINKIKKMFQISIDKLVVSRMKKKTHPNILKTVGGDIFPVNIYFFNKNWQHCKLATVSIFKTSLIDLPIDAFDGGMSDFGVI